MPETLFEGKAGKSKGWTTDELVRGLRAMYEPPAYGILFEVPNGTGTVATRSCDAMAMSLWPSRGIDLIGFEIKASRSDWVKEMKDPSKADALGRYCDLWFLVVGHESIVQEGELPPAWGLIAPRGNKLAVRKVAKSGQSAPMTRNILAGIFRRICEKVEREDLANLARKEGFDAGRKEGVVSGQNMNKWEAQHLRDEIARLNGVISEFEKASGIALSVYGDNRRLGQAVKLLTAGFPYATEPIDDAILRAEGLVSSLQGLREARSLMEAKQDDA